MLHLEAESRLATKDCSLHCVHARLPVSLTFCVLNSESSTDRKVLRLRQHCASPLRFKEEVTATLPIGSIRSTFGRKFFCCLASTIHHISPDIPTSVAEITTGIICSCLPTLPALFRHFLPNVRSLVSCQSQPGSQYCSRRQYPISRHPKARTNSQPCELTNAASFRSSHYEYIDLDKPSRLGVTTMVHGDPGQRETQGHYHSQPRGTLEEERPRVDEESGSHLPDDVILKTVQIEQVE